MSLLGQVETVQMLVRQLDRINTDPEVEEKVEKILYELEEIVETITGERKIPW